MSGYARVEQAFAVIGAEASNAASGFARALAGRVLTRDAQSAAADVLRVLATVWFVVNGPPVHRAASCARRLAGRHTTGEIQDAALPERAGRSAGERPRRPRGPEISVETLSHSASRTSLRTKSVG